MPQRLTSGRIQSLVDDGRIVSASDNIYDAVIQIKNSGEYAVSLPEGYLTPTDEINQNVKGLDSQSFISLDSVPVIQEGLLISKGHADYYGKPWSLPDGRTIGNITRLTDEICHGARVYPKYFIKAGMQI